MPRTAIAQIAKLIGQELESGAGPPVGSARAPARRHASRALPGDGEEHPNIVPVHRPSAPSRRTARRLVPRLATRNRQSAESNHDVFLCLDFRR